MNKVTVKYRGHLAALTGIAEETLEAVDVNGALKSLRKIHGRQAAKAARSMLITLNGESILLLNSYKTPLYEGDVLSFLPICAGG